MWHVLVRVRGANKSRDFNELMDSSYSQYSSVGTINTVTQTRQQISFSARPHTAKKILKGNGINDLDWPVKGVVGKVAKYSISKNHSNHLSVNGTPQL